LGPIAEDRLVREAFEMDDELPPVVDDVTGLANRRGFLEMLKMEERRRARYGGSPTLMIVDVERSVARLAPEVQAEKLIQIAAVLADAIRDTDTLGRIGDYRFGLLAIGAGSAPTPITGRLRLFLEMKGVQATVSVGAPGDLEEAWQELDGSARPALRVVRDDADAARRAEND
jgi:GGDEF domain-containing protein